MACLSKVLHTTSWNIVLLRHSVNWHLVAKVSRLQGCIETSVDPCNFHLLRIGPFHGATLGLKKHWPQVRSSIVKIPHLVDRSRLNTNKVKDTKVTLFKALNFIAKYLPVDSPMCSMKRRERIQEIHLPCITKARSAYATLHGRKCHPRGREKMPR